MESDIGRWLPVWIIGAPLVFALFDRMRTPRVRDADRNHSTLSRTRTEGLPAR